MSYTLDTNENHECYEHAPVLQTNKDLTDDLEALDPISLYFTLNVLNINKHWWFVFVFTLCINPLL